MEEYIHEKGPGNPYRQLNYRIMRKLTVALLSVVIAFLIVVQYVKTPTAIQESQYDGIPWETLSYS